MVKKLTPEELASLERRVMGKKHPVRVAIEQLKAGEAILVTRKEFTWKGRSPQRLCNEISKKSKKRFQVSVLLDNSGWVVERVDGGK